MPEFMIVSVMLEWKWRMFMLNHKNSCFQADKKIKLIALKRKEKGLSLNL